MTIEYILKYDGLKGLEFPSLVLTQRTDAFISSLDIGTDYDSICFRNNNERGFSQVQSLRIYRLDHAVVDFEPHKYVRLMDAPSRDVDKLTLWLMVCRGDRISTANDNLYKQNDNIYTQIRLELEVLQLTEELLVKAGKLQFPDFYISLPDFKKVPKRENQKTVYLV